LTRAPNGPIFSSPETRELLLNVAKELASLAITLKIPGFTEEFPQNLFNLLEGVAKLQPGSSASTMRDYVSGKPSEMNDLLGNAVRIGKANNIPLPLCNAAYAILILGEKKARGEIHFPNM
jgi:2-dehydropantoate 2-reductase